MVRNTKHDAKWGTEERSGEFPVNAGEPFTLNILAEETQFAISFNGKLFCNFAYRQPLDQGDYIEFKGTAESLTIYNPSENDKDSETDVIAMSKNSV